MKAKASEAAIISLGLVAFLALSLHQMELPGLNYDEAFDVVPAMQLLLGRPIELLRGSGIRIAGRTFPLMVMDYKGTVHTYLTIPFFLLLGINVFTLRLSTVTFATLTLLATYFLARELYGRRAAAIAFFLLAVNPSFVFWSRQGVLWTSIMTLFSTGSLFFLLKWWHKKSQAYLYLGAFFIGLGLSAKLSFLWFPLALAATWLTLGRPIPPRLDGVQAAIAALSFLIGASPLIIYNLQTGGTIKVLLENLTTSYYGTSNLAFFSNLKVRASQFGALLTGRNFWYLGGGCGNDLYPVLFLAIAVGSLSLAIKAREDWRKVAFPLLMMAFMVVESCATVSSLWPEHYLILLPLPQLAIAAGVSVLVRRSGLSTSQSGDESALSCADRGVRERLTPLNLLDLSKLALGAAILIVALLMGGDLWVDWRYHRALAYCGGLRAHSDAVYKLADYLDEQGVASPLAMDWGIKTSVQFLTLGRVNPVELFGYESTMDVDPTLEERLAPFLENSDSLFIFHSKEATAFQGRREAFERLAEAGGKKLMVEKILYDRGGEPVFELVRVE